MAKPKQHPSQDVLMKLLSYDPDTGLFVWKTRPRELCPSDRSWNTFNSKSAGKKAFATKCVNGYLAGRLFGKDYYAHRIAWKIHYGCDPVNQIDHINGNRTDNRIKNLREVTHRENSLNQKHRSTNTSGHMGVDIDRGKWRAHITIHGKFKHIGYFDTMVEAIAARKAAEEEYGFHKHHGGHRS